MAQYGRPDSDITTTNVASGTYDSINETTASDADYLYGTNNTNVTYECSLTDVTDPASATAHYFRYRVAKTKAGVVDGGGSTTYVTAYLYEGTTLRATGTQRTLTGSWTTCEDALTEAEANSITDYTNLRIRFYSPASGGSAANRRSVGLSWAELEVPPPSSTDNQLAYIKGFSTSTDNQLAYMVGYVPGLLAEIDFEEGDFSEFDTVIGDTFSVSSINPLAGTYSLKHTSPGSVSGTVIKYIDFIAREDYAYLRFLANTQISYTTNAFFVIKGDSWNIAQIFVLSSNRVGWSVYEDDHVGTPTEYSPSVEYDTTYCIETLIKKATNETSGDGWLKGYVNNIQVVEVTDIDNYNLFNDNPVAGRLEIGGSKYDYLISWYDNIIIRNDDTRSPLLYDVNDSQLAYLSGSTGTPVTDNQPVYLKGQSTNTDNQPVYLSGYSTSTLGQPVYLSGKAETTDQQPTYLIGKAEIVDNQVVYLYSAIALTDQQPTYLVGQASAVDTQPAYLICLGISTLSQPAYIFGQPELIVGSVTWGHSTGVVEDNVETFSGNWYGTGEIENSGDSEQLTLDTDEYMDSGITETGEVITVLLQNIYSSGDDVTLFYRTASSASGIYSANWTEYTTPFDSLGYAQARVVNIPWYLSGGISADNCLIAYMAKGAADLAASYVNLANVGTYTLSQATGDYIPSFNTATGWTFDGSNDHLVIATGVMPKPLTYVARITHDNTAVVRVIFGSALNGAPILKLRVEHKMNAQKRGVADIGNSTTVIPASDTVVAWTYSAAGVYTFYLAGSADGTGTNDQTFTQAMNRIGSNGSGGAGDEPFKGVIAAIAVYDIALSADEVSALSTAMAEL